MNSFETVRKRITDALTTAGIMHVIYNPSVEPDSDMLPGAVVVLKELSGENESSEGWIDNNFNFQVYIVVSAQDKSDPDSELYALQQQFRGAYRVVNYKDISEAQYYSTMMGSTGVRIARMDVTDSATRDDYIPISQD